jgi:hypothetical protein
MCAMARKAATSIFRADDEDEDPETEVEVTNSQTGSEKMSPLLLFMDLFPLLKMMP